MYDQPTGKRKLLDGRDRDVFATPRRFVRLGPNGNNLVPVLQTTTQGRNSCRRCAHENYAHRLTVIRRLLNQEQEQQAGAGVRGNKSRIVPAPACCPCSWFSCLRIMVSQLSHTAVPISALLVTVAPTRVAETLACINSRRYSRPPAFESVPDMLKPPNGCTPTSAPVHLRFK